MPFETVSEAEFFAAIAAGPTSRLFKSHFARLRPRAYDGWAGPDFQIHRGPLTVAGTFEAPGFFTLVTGDLTVDGLIDLHNPYDKGFDEGGFFLVLGHVTCQSFANEYGKCSVIDGHLKVRDVLLNDFEDAALCVTGDLTTRFFAGSDICAEVGGRAIMEYGEGHCLPIGHAAASIEAIWPKHGAEESWRHVARGEAGQFEPHRLLRLLREGRPVLTNC